MESEYEKQKIRLYVEFLKRNNTYRKFIFKVSKIGLGNFIESKLPHRYAYDLSMDHWILFGNPYEQTFGETWKRYYLEKGSYIHEIDWNYTLDDIKAFFGDKYKKRIPQLEPTIDNFIKAFKANVISRDKIILEVYPTGYFEDIKLLKDDFEKIIKTTLQKRYWQLYRKISGEKKKGQLRIDVLERYLKVFDCRNSLQNKRKTKWKDVFKALYPKESEFTEDKRVSLLRDYKKAERLINKVLYKHPDEISFNVTD